MNHLKQAFASLLAMSMVATSPAAESGTLAEALVGTWRIVDYLAVRDDGHEVRPMGPGLQGYIMYAADGHLSVNLMKPGRARFASNDLMLATEAERAAAAESYFAYAGTFQVDEVQKLVVHRVLYSLMPNWVDTEQRRLIFLSGDQLELRSPGPVMVGGEQRVLRILWERAGR